MDWCYPISDECIFSGFIMPVREGILWIPYDEVNIEDGEILRLDCAELLESDSIERMMEDFRSYANNLLSTLEDMIEIAECCESEQV